MSTSTPHRLRPRHETPNPPPRRPRRSPPRPGGSLLRVTSLLGVLVCFWAGPPALGQAGAPPPGEDAVRQGPTLSLQSALALAFEHSPALVLEHARVQEAEASVAGARTYPNPVVELEAADRDENGTSSTDRGLGVGQPLLLGGQRSKETAAARSGLRAARDAFRRGLQELAARVERSFAEAVAARESLRVAEQDAELARQLLDYESRRLSLGAGTQLDLNLARAASGRAERGLQGARAAWLEARARLAEVIGMEPGAPPRPQGELPEAAAAAEPLEALLSRAALQRPDLEAARQAVEQTRRRLEWQRSLALPRLRAGVFGAREEGQDLLGIRLGVSVPVFDRNQEGVARARSEIDAAEARLRLAELALEREVTAAHARSRAARRSLQALDRLVVGTLEESLHLLGRARQEGEVRAAEVLVLRRELVTGTRERIAAALDLWKARVDLELAVGDVVVPVPMGERSRGNHGDGEPSHGG